MTDNDHGTAVAETGPLVIRKATLDDLDAIKSIADGSKDLIGFVLRPALVENILRQWVLVAEIGGQVIGFANYRHRQDQQTTLYEICVTAPHRNDGVGVLLIEALIEESQSQGKRRVLLRCPQESQANAFYCRLGFQKIGTEEGKRRRLVIWEKHF
jgi:predicted GNAT family acetyltransferase